MCPSTGSGAATPGQSLHRQGPPRLGGAAYETSPAAATVELKSRASSRKGVKPDANVTTLPPAGREEQLERWGLSTSRHWREVECAPRHAADDVDAEYEGHERELEELGFVQEGGWTLVDSARGHAGIGGATGGARDAGMSAHRGVLHPDEFINADDLRELVEANLGFTYEQVRAVYRQGPKSTAQLELRSRIGARLLEISAAGGNLLELARSFGWAIDESSTTGGANCRTMERAVERARKERA